MVKTSTESLANSGLPQYPHVYAHNIVPADICNIREVFQDFFVFDLPYFLFLPFSCMQINTPAGVLFSIAADSYKEP